MSTCRETEHLLEAYIDGDLSQEQRCSVEAHLATCEACQRELALARRVSAGLRSLPLQTCPERILEEVLEKTGQKRGWLRLLPDLSFIRPRYALGFSLGLVVIMVTVLAITRYGPSPQSGGPYAQYSEQEIAQARKDILLAFGYVNYASSRAQDVIENDVLPRHVVRPLRQGLEYINLSKQKGVSL